MSEQRIPDEEHEVRLKPGYVLTTIKNPQPSGCNAYDVYLSPPDDLWSGYWLGRLYSDDDYDRFFEPVDPAQPRPSEEEE